MLHVFPLEEESSRLIGFIFSYNKATLESLRSHEFIKYSKTQKCFYIKYDAAEFALLKSLGIPMKVYENREVIKLDMNIGNVNELKPHNSVEKTKNQIAINYNNQRLWIKMKYNSVDVAKIKGLTSAYWNTNQKLWSIAANIDNLDKLQKHFNYWTLEQYNHLHELICTVAEPKIMEIYRTPEHHNEKLCIKLKGFGIDTHYMSQIQSSIYEPDLKRWLIPFNDNLLTIIKNHYMHSGAKIIESIYQKEDQYKKQDFRNHEKQNFLLNKYPAEYRELLLQYTDAMIRTNLKWTTIQTYTPEMVKFAKYIGIQNIPLANETSINKYLSELSGQQKSYSIVHTAINAIKYYYQKVIFKHDIKINQIIRPKGEFHLPTILSTNEINHLLESLSNTKHICILYIFYGCGLRLNELLATKLDDVWWDRNQLFVEGGKGAKDRVVNLGQTLKELLRKYFDEYQPKYWLFEGQDKMKQYSGRSAQKVVKNALSKAGITKKVSPHTLRHCFATHLLDSGVQLPYIQRLLGHQDIKTTMIYTHVTTQSIASVISPLDHLKRSNTQS